jgi:hypothetical protein
MKELVVVVVKGVVVVVMEEEVLSLLGRTGSLSTDSEKV